MDDEYSPSNASNFLERYHSWRNQQKSSASSTSPSMPKRANSQSKDVWSSVFQPYGRSPTGHSRYDSTKKSPVTAPKSPDANLSMSEIHDYGKMKSISLDEPKE
mmetsp:Transcript_9119/g.27444  ORF Transcript_9119/g.27444 Transcript_9119/m.27444 type:complete len:104 (-) Transcript_9119:96-407(-)|eukprot:CAMPEP_0198724064 /NCGR_PEP_ID=MMETSP1475-20131203/1557_1 /TAXON_ID= ORGANISM="Unidentified sp., Strain CCMP1999" /NCGR_SAMPLE_ID=MMETSP1475 /ASSEMBLY_ACC=CAM_ASM_001111 /LENGTH=103 /DNA_ID=CAMNT_0044485457 /DNA_START=194 /DNA_END=505 /DNA_ORIENTATION=+